ncbi:MAG: zinc ribbon domain-containing protein [Desulfobacterales bacterium]|nr:zinc ribbon domain-containing protein [Desulfobacterales bacterium]
MECPSCQAANPAGQRYCGTCGHTLETACPQCQASNPPHHKFCGRCGASLSAVAAITLARSGLITQVNPQALALLGYQHGEMQGKSFSLFVKRPDLVVFFSHWNELLSKGETQAFEITLNHKGQNSICVRLACSVDRRPPKAIAAVDLVLTEITDSRAAAAQMQAQQELLGLTFSMASNISTVGGMHLAHAMEEALKKICLFTNADRGCIHGINRSSNRLETLYEWRHASVSSPEAGSGSKSIPFSKIKQTLVRLLQEKTVVVDDTAQLAPSEREEWRAWLADAPGAAIGHLIYSGTLPVGVIAVIKRTAGDPWAPNSVGLVQFMGNLVADRLPAGPAHGVRRSQANGPKERPEDVIDHGSQGTVPHGESKPAPAERTSKKRGPAASPIARPMVLEKLSGDPEQDRQPVFPRDDGLVLLTCPACGILAPVALDQFDKLGNAIRVSCSCGKQFTAVLEKRRFFRKSVRLEGYFSSGGDLGPIGAEGTLWGTMVVKDLSRAGLRFAAAKASLLHPGDLVMVRFNLDNANQALIHKPARVIAITSHGVGCRFEGADKYDITLGFYLM